MHGFAAFEEDTVLFPLEDHAQSMGEGRAMRLATRNFYGMGHDGDTSSIKNIGAWGREIPAKFGTLRFRCGHHRQRLRKGGPREKWNT